MLCTAQPSPGPNLSSPSHHEDHTSHQWVWHQRCCFIPGFISPVPILYMQWVSERFSRVTPHHPWLGAFPHNLPSSAVVSSSLEACPWGLGLVPPAPRPPAPRWSLSPQQTTAWHHNANATVSHATEAHCTPPWVPWRFMPEC